MRMFVRRAAGTVAVALAPMAYLTTLSPGVASALPLDCGPGNYWSPGTNACRPEAIPPPPGGCGVAMWWNPEAHECQEIPPAPYKPDGASLRPARLHNG